MTERSGFTEADARRIGSEIGIDWTSSPFDVDELRRGMNVELEHGLSDSGTSATELDHIVTARIALAHLAELPDYYTRLAVMEADAEG